MQIKINGQTSEVQDKITIQELIRDSAFRDSLIVVELNGTITLRDSWSSPLKDNDSLEIVRVIGGG